MATLNGVLGLLDSERDFINDVGHAIIYDHINAVLEEYNAEIANLFNVFVDHEITQDTLRFVSPIVGMSSAITENVPAAAVASTGSWDVAFPIRGWGDALGITRWGQAYMTVQALSSKLEGLKHRNLARIRRRIMIALFEDTNWVGWLDPTQDNTALTIRRLANTDGTLFPPVFGSDTEADDDHYAETEAGFTIADIADALNPLTRLRDEVVEHFHGRDRRSQGEDFIVFMNSDAEQHIRGLTDFVPILDKYVDWGQDTDKSQFIDNMPGRVIGRSDGCWCSVYAAIPATYMLGVHLDYPPLLKRVDPGYTGLGGGYRLVAENEDHPLISSQYENRYGFAVANRLSAAVLEISGGDGAYTPPADYAE